MIKKLQLLVIIFGVLLVSCFKTDEVPPLTFDEKANMTIAEFKELHPLGFLPPTLIEEDIILSGVVTSTDQYGGSYKEIFFQDATGGISIRTSNTSYYAKYRIGQRIFVKANGLYLGNYYNSGHTSCGNHQIGLFGNDNGGLEFLSPKAENLHVFRDGLPKPVTPKVISKFSDIEDTDYNTLVKLTNCTFLSGNGTVKYFVPSGTLTTTSQKAKFKLGGGEVEVRISQYCTFADSILPDGLVDITGILTLYGGQTYSATTQLILCDVNDVYTYPKEKVLKEFDMSTDPFSKENGWTNKQVLGDTKWQYNSSGNVIIQEPSGKTECWLVSPKLNFTGEKDIALFFNYRIRNAINDNIGLAYTIDGTNWKPIEFTPVIGPNADGAIYLPDDIATHPNLQIAFQYKATDNFPIWLITKITFKANVTM